MANEPAARKADEDGGWRSHVPLLGVLRSYDRTVFSSDLTAGLIVAVISVPQAVAYAYLAGLPPSAGLYACLVPMVLYTLLGSSRHLVVGPTAVAALMVAAAIGAHAPDYGGDHLGVATVICLEAGLFLLLLRLTQMGGVVHLLSHPVITGFVNAAAILIIASQLSAFTGVAAERDGLPIAALFAVFQNFPSFNAVTLILGLGSLLLLWTAARYGPRLVGWAWPRLAGSPFVAQVGPLLTLLLATLLVAALDLDTSFGVATAGDVPSGLPELTLPPVSPLMWLALMPSSAMIAAVAFVESYTIGTSLANREHTRLDSGQELLALGAANLAAGISGATPVAGSFSRSSLNYRSGARTPVSSLVCAAVILVTLLFLTPLFANLPQATLAAIVIVCVVGLIDLRAISHHWKLYREDGVTGLITMATVLAFGVETGLIAGVLASIAFFVRRSSRPHIALVGRIGESESFRAARRHEVETHDHVTAVRIDENIYFANANHIESKLHRLIARRPGTHQVLVVCSAVNIIDVSGVEMLARLNDNLTQEGIKLHLSDVKWPVMAQLKRSKLPDELTGRIFFTTDEAMNALADQPAEHDGEMAIQNSDGI